MSQPDIAPSTGRPPKVLRFVQEDNDKLEGTALLTNINTSDSPAHAPLIFGSMSASNLRTSEQQNERPPGLQEAPAAFTLWPGSSMSIVCPQCGNYVEVCVCYCVHASIMGFVNDSHHACILQLEDTCNSLVALLWGFCSCACKSHTSA